MLAAVVSAGGDRAVAVTTIAFQYFGMHVFFICVLNVYFMVGSLVHGWVRNEEIKMINQSNQISKDAADDAVAKTIPDDEVPGCVILSCCIYR